MDILETALISDMLSDEIARQYISAKITEEHFSNTDNKNMFRALKKVEGDYDIIIIAREAMVELEYVTEVMKHNIYLKAYKEHVDEIIKRKFISDVKNISNDILNETSIENIMDNIKSLESMNLILNKKTDTLTDVYQSVINDIENQDKREQINTGFKDLDYKLGGMKEGNLVVVAARPGMGKTALALNIANNIVKNKKNVLLFSLEMSNKELLQRLLVINLMVNSKGFNSKFNNAEVDAIVKYKGVLLKQLRTLNIYDNADNSINEIKAITAEYAAQKKVDCIIIDYLQLMNAKGFKNRNDEVGYISRECKKLAKRYKCPVILLSQLNRGIESRSSWLPLMSDLRDSGSIEQDADSIIFIAKESAVDMGLSEQDELAVENVYTLVLAKNRHGETGIARVIFQKEYSKMMDCTKNIKGKLL